ncbi:MAG: hypothetical protein ACREMA_17040, partial [Longimicrobiales bacterium]
RRPRMVCVNESGRAKHARRVQAKDGLQQTHRRRWIVPSIVGRVERSENPPIGFLFSVSVLDFLNL